MELYRAEMSNEHPETLTSMNNLAITLEACPLPRGRLFLQSNSALGFEGTRQGTCGHAHDNV